MRTFALALATSAFLLSGAASAHFKMVMPPSPTPSVDGKGAPPCGPDTGEGTVTSVKGGSQIALSVEETVRHGGFYRVALALKSCKTAGCFPANNKVYDEDNMLLAPTGPGTSDHADIDPAPKFPILADGLFPHTEADDGTGPAYTGMITIPNVTCEKCTMQIIEFMAPHGPNGSAGYFYHHCADLKITADPAKPIFDPDRGMGGGGSGGGSGGGAGTGGAAAGSSNVGGASGSETGGAGGSSSTAGTPASTGGSAVITAGTSSTTAGTAPTPSGGAPGSGTAGTSTAGTATATPPNGATAEDESGCGMAKGTQGHTSALATLGLLFALVRRRRVA